MDAFLDKIIRGNSQKPLVYEVFENLLFFYFACICKILEDKTFTYPGILIIVVLIGLVIIFQTNIKNVVSAIFNTINSNVGKIK